MKTEKKCGLCKTRKPIAAFTYNTGRVSAWCHPCKNLYMTAVNRDKGVKEARQRNPEHLAQGLKECFECDALLPLDDFPSNKQGVGGKASFCKKCRSRKERERLLANKKNESL